MRSTAFVHRINQLKAVKFLQLIAKIISFMQCNFGWNWEETAIFPDASKFNCCNLVLMNRRFSWSFLWLFLLRSCSLLAAVISQTGRIAGDQVEEVFVTALLRSLLRRRSCGRAFGSESIDWICSISLVVGANLADKDTSQSNQMNSAIVIATAD